MRTRPDELNEIVLPEGRVTVDEHGYLTNPDLWSRDFAEYVAAAEGLVLGPDHWAVIGFMRDYQEQHGIMADARFVMDYLGQGKGKRAGRARLFELFPYGYVMQACKIAGMKQPRAWSTG